MIVVELAGGLGNQMFQYAFGYASSKRANSDLRMDLSFLKRRDFGDDFSYFDYALDIFKLKTSFLSEPEEELYQKRPSKLMSKLFRKVYPPISPYVKENTIKFVPSYLNLNKDVFLRGYWQNPRYFEEFSNEIKDEFRFDVEWSDQGKGFSEKLISKKTPVSVHFRRGDYLKNSFNAKTCTPEYYRKAMDYIAEKVEDPYFFIFSNDTTWVKENFQSNYNFEIIEWKPYDPKYHYEDMRLMTLCKHNILANSSYSWWGAYLGRNEDKVVVAPKLWDQRRDTSDIICPNWTMI